MNRKRRTFILVQQGGSLAKEMAEEIAALFPVSILSPSEEGLVMVKMRESARKSQFYLGEVLVSHCKVLVQGAVGIGIVRGIHPEFAHNLAVIDAAYSANLTVTRGWSTRLELAEDEIRKRLRIEDSQVLATKVSFDSMDRVPE